MLRDLGLDRLEQRLGCFEVGVPAETTHCAVRFHSIGAKQLFG